MCGIAGLLASDPARVVEARDVVQRMTGRLSHRGPDGHGVWVDDVAGVALGHRRLAIVDLSPAGAQPMQSADGRWVVTYNGEIYNRQELATELTDVPFRGHSDTEVLLEGIARWGVGSTVRKCIGMFAFAAWDRLDRRLYLVRDRLGIKPLYWATCGGTILFGSELSALRAHPAFDSEIDLGAVAAYFRYCTVPAPLSIYRSTRKVLPGTILAFGAGSDEPVSEVFWSAMDVANASHARPFDGTYEEGLDALERLLGDSVARRMVADVPLGAFLSGGIDSSLVVALMQSKSSRPIKTFTIGSIEPSFDESGPARDVAKALGTDHTELLVTPREAQAVIPELPQVYDEPFADPSMIPTLLVSRLARASVTVALSGDGGDELFGGYNRHLWAPRIWRAMRYWPLPVRAGLSKLIRSVSASTWDVVAARAKPLLPASLEVRLPGGKLHKLASILSAKEPRELYTKLTIAGAADVVIGATESTDPWQAAMPPTLFGFSEQMMLLDLTTYLPDDILTKVDRASMAVALEARVPMIDHRVVALAWQFPQDFRIRNGITKAPLRDLLSRFLPRILFERPKSGFGIPVGDWVRGPLRDWAEDLLDARRIRSRGVLDEHRVAALWRNHLEGRTSDSAGIWSVLMFQAWLSAQSTQSSTVCMTGGRFESARGA
ncbi:MAG TPA: asparagine synthase (glutamine-hydrolyzing) [Polyangiaceae bacterium]|nr:asparagine synthase (glutamine-hydrolyzing) [Polyangiaceae bacterium]